jgi:hypothetical protein
VWRACRLNFSSRGTALGLYRTGQMAGMQCTDWLSARGCSSCSCCVGGTFGEECTSGNTTGILSAQVRTAGRSISSQGHGAVNSLFSPRSSLLAPRSPQTYHVRTYTTTLRKRMKSPRGGYYYKTAVHASKTAGKLVKGRHPSSPFIHTSN